MKSPLLHRLLVLSLLLMASACNQSEILQKFASPEEQASARSYVELLRQRRFADIEKAADPSIRDVSFRDTLARMSALLPVGDPISVTLVGAHRMNMHRTNMPDSLTVNLTLEYHFQGKWLLTNVAVERQDGGETIVGFNVYPQSSSLEKQNEFTLDGKTWIHYLVLSLAIIFPLLTLYALVVCVRTRLRGRKWLWILFIVLGLGKFAVNWTTGQWAYALPSIQPFSASAVAAPYGPWTLAVSLPLGAVTFLLLRRRLSTLTGKL